MKISELLNEEQRDKYCSDKCCGSNVKAEDCKCPPTCKHCNCNDPTVSETATVGATSAGAIASISSVPGAKRKITKRGKYGAPEAPQKRNADGTAKNALDVKDNIMGGKPVKR
jgi:hypothetical protein